MGGFGEKGIFGGIVDVFQRSMTEKAYCVACGVEYQVQSYLLKSHKTHVLCKEGNSLSALNV
jgi:hypothetical protein